MASEVVQGEVIKSETEPVERPPKVMKELMRLLNLTPSEIAQIDSGVSLEEIRANQKALQEMHGDNGAESVDSVNIAHQDTDESPSQSEPSDQMTLARKSVLEIEKLIEELETIKNQAPDKEKIRWEAWSLRVQGYSADVIAQKFGKSRQLIYQYWEWCKSQLPYIKDQVEEFQSVTVARLEAQYRQLAVLRARGDVLAHKVSLEIVERQAKVLGVDKMNEPIETRVTYIFPGVDMDKL